MLVIYQAVFGGEHQFTATCQHNLGLMLHGQRRFGEAEEQVTSPPPSLRPRGRVLPRSPAGVEEGHRSLTRQVIASLRERGKLDDAAALEQKVRSSGRLP